MNVFNHAFQLQLALLRPHQQLLILYLMHFNLKVIIFNSIYIKANYNAIKGIRYIVQNLNRILDLNFCTTYKPFLLPLPIPQLYYVYFYYQLSPITSYELLQTFANSEANWIARIQALRRV